MHENQAIRNTVTILSLVLAVFINTHTELHADTPKVVRTAPLNHTSDVSAEVDQLRVEFDQDMDQTSYSWVRWGSGFPQLAGKPKWLNARTCVLPVRLEPGRVYTLGINNASFSGFKNRAGEPAAPFVFSFATEAALGGARAKILTAEQNLQAVEKLRNAIDKDYSYRDLRNVDWNRQFDRYKDALVKSWSPDEFAFYASAMLAPAADSHLWVKVDQMTISTHQRKVVPNFSLEALKKTVRGLKKRNDAIWTGQLDGDIAYILITTWKTEFKKLLDELPNVLDECAKAKGLVVDVRPNGGGNESLAREFAGRFVDKQSVYAKHLWRDPKHPNGFRGPIDRIIQPVKTGPRFGGPVAVLMGPQNVSSCEAFLLMMKQAPNCKLVGDQSFGSSGNPAPVDLGNGVSVFVPRWQAMNAAGEVFEGKGIAPDIRIQTQPGDFANGDPVLQAAVHWLMKKNAS